MLFPRKFVRRIRIVLLLNNSLIARGSSSSSFRKCHLHIHIMIINIDFCCLANSEINFRSTVFCVFIVFFFRFFIFLQIVATPPLPKRLLSVT